MKKWEVGIERVEFEQFAAALASENVIGSLGSDLNSLVFLKVAGTVCDLLSDVVILLSVKICVSSLLKLSEKGLAS